MVYSFFYNKKCFIVLLNCYIIYSMPSNLVQKNLAPLGELSVSLENTGSVEFQIVGLTHRIGYLSSHIKKHKHDHATKRSIVILVNQRKKLMKYYNRKNPEALAKLTAILDIRNTAI